MKEESLSEKIDIRDYDWVIEGTNEPVIVNGIALRDLEKGERLVSYGKLLTEEDLKGGKEVENER